MVELKGITLSGCVVVNVGFNRSMVELKDLCVGS